jgi:hypothetical protein
MQVAAGQPAAQCLLPLGLAIALVGFEEFGTFSLGKMT